MSDHLTTRETTYVFYLVLKIGCIDKTHTKWSLKLFISILTDYYKTLLSVLSRGTTNY